MADGLFVGWVNVVVRADVEGDGHGGVDEAEGSALRVANFAPVFAG